MFRVVEERYHRLDCLMANAGVPLQGALLNNQTKDLQHMMQVRWFSNCVCLFFRQDHERKTERRDLRADYEELKTRAGDFSN